MLKRLTLVLLMSLAGSLIYSVEIVDGGFLLTRAEFEYANERIDLAAWYETTEVPRIHEDYEVLIAGKNMLIDSLEGKVSSLVSQRRYLVFGLIAMPIITYLIGALQ